MSYGNIVSRTDAQALVPEVVSTEMIQNLTAQSAALQMFRRIPVSTNQTRFPVISALPVAYFVSGDTGLKQTTEVNWANVYLNIEEIATIVPVPEAVFEDAGYDIWATVRPLMEQAIARTLDAAVFFGTNKPSSWPASVAAGAVSAGNVATRTTASQANGGVASDINDVMSAVEDDGFDVSGFVANRTLRGKIRKARDTTGQKLLDITPKEIEGNPVMYTMDGLWPTGTGAAEMFAGDFTHGVLGVRRDMTLKMLDQAVIQDNSGAIIFNLAQQDMVAARLTFRVGWQMDNTLNYVNANSATRYPFAILQAP